MFQRNLFGRTKKFVLLCAASVAVLSLSIMWASQQTHSQEKGLAMGANSTTSSGTLERATFGAGCFWCTEAVFQQLEGVRSAVSGYSGGHAKNPTYSQVCDGSTGHAEVVQIEYDPDVISFAKLLEVFWATHDPTTPNRQGADIGPQYRSAIFFHDDRQRQLAEQYKQKLNESDAFQSPIVTQIVPFQEFYPAEDYHQEYFERNPRQPYCSRVILPKLNKFKQAFRDKLKAKPDPVEKVTKLHQLGGA